MTPAEEYRQRAIEFFDLAAKSNDSEEREALRTFALCCLQLERAEEDRRQKASQPSQRATIHPTQSRLVGDVVVTVDRGR